MKLTTTVLIAFTNIYLGDYDTVYDTVYHII